MSEVEIVYRSSKDCWDFKVTDMVVSESRLMNDIYLREKKENPEKKQFIYVIPGISKRILSMAIGYCKIKPNSRLEFYQLDFVSLFNLIQAAHFLKIKELMDKSCPILAFTAHTIPVNLGNIDFADPQLSEDDCSRLLRSRPKDAFINPSEFSDVHFSPFVLRQLHSIKRGQATFDEHFRKIMSFESLEGLLEDIRSFEEFIEADPRAACRISVSVRTIISILSRARFSIWGEEMQNELLPVLVKYARDPNNGFTILAVIALTRIAFDFPDLIKVMVDMDVLEAAHKTLDNHLEVYWSMQHLAKFLAAICRGHGFSCNDHFSSEKVAKILTILDSVCCKWPYQYRMVHTFTCYALLYLSYGSCVIFEAEVWNRLRGRLVDYISIGNNPGPECKLGIRANVSRKVNLDQMLAGSALGVVGHIMRWGNQDQMQSLTEVPKFWECLESMLCSFKKFQKEALQIISNLAAKRILIPDVIKHKPAKILLSPEGVGSDVLMEAAWAVFNITCVQEHLPVGRLQIDEYPG
ncbi:hypothetical protein OROHE_005795 [Orobanche hederae]